MPTNSPRSGLQHALEVLHFVRPSKPDEFPDFLVIAPPKTGTTWLARQLGRHPGIFIPAEKELKYFSFFRKSRDLEWYLSHFRAATGKLKGEATPNYALLPVSTIRKIRKLHRDIKLIFLMRDPIERAWSHARWSHRVQEGVFCSTQMPIDLVPEELWRESFLNPLLVLSSDYLGQLQRWLAVFNRRQVFVAFTDQMQASPRGLLNDIFNFLEVKRPALEHDTNLNERVNVGEARGLNHELRDCLRRIYARRTGKLLDFVRNELGIDAPPAWKAWLAAADFAPSRGTDDTIFDDLCSRLARSVNDRQLDYLLQQAERLHPHIVESRRDWNIVEFRGRFYGLPWRIGAVDFFDRPQLDCDEIVAAATREEIRQHIDRSVAAA